MTFSLHSIALLFLISFSMNSLLTAQTDSTTAKDSTAKISGVTVPAGTKFLVNINSTLSNSKNVAGSSFTAILAADFVSNGKVISPKGSQVIGKIVESKGGQGIGDAKLSFQFTDVTVNKLLTPIVTDPIEVKGGRGRKGQVEVVAGTLEEIPLKSALVIK
jgi:hypothetical protein